MNREMEFRAQFLRLRANYDTAFRKLCRAKKELQALGEGTAAEVVNGAKQTVEACRQDCSQARNKLAIFLLARKVEKKSCGLKKKNARSSDARGSGQVRASGT